MILHFLSCLFFTLYYLSGSECDSRGFMLYVIIYNLACLIPFYFSLCKHKSNSIWISGVTLFLLSYIIVFFQYDFHYAIGLDVIANRVWFLWGSEENIGKALLLSSAGFHIFLGGYCVILRKKNKSVQLKNKLQQQLFMFGKNHFILPLYTVCIISYLVFLYFSGSYIHGGYDSQLSERGLRAYLYHFSSICFNMLVIQRLFYIVNTAEPSKLSPLKYIKLMGLPITLLSVLMVIFPLLAGDRGPVITIFIMYSSLYLCRFSKLRAWQFILIIFLVSSTLAFIGVFRATDYKLSYTERYKEYEDKKEGKSAGYFDTIDRENVYLKGTLELGSSVRVLHHMLDNVPENYPHMYGWMQFQQFAGFIPLFLRSLNNSLGVNKYYYSSTIFASYLIQGDNIKYGDGTNMISDFYLDCNIWGVIIGMFLFGLFLAKIDKILESEAISNLFVFSAAIIYYPLMIYIPRSTALVGLKSLLLVFICNVIYYKFMAFILNRKLTR